MKKIILPLLIIIICTAAGAAVTYALTDSPGEGESVEACFTDASVYDEVVRSREQKEFDASLLQYEGVRIPYDRETGTLFIPQSCGSAQWEGTITSRQPGARIYIRNEGEYTLSECLREGTVFKIAVADEKTYMESSLVFTGLPVIAIRFDQDFAQIGEEYTASWRILDPYGKEYKELGCAFHVRGNTSLMFDKKSYRITLRDGARNKIHESFLGMRSDDDWILNSLGTDKTLAREKVSYMLWEKLNENEEQPVPSSRIEYAELFMNDSYQGVYGLMFPVDKKLMKMESGDILYKVKTWQEENDVPGKLTDYNGESAVFNTNGFSYAEIKYPRTAEDGPFLWDPFEAYQDMVFETGDPVAMERSGVRIDRDNFILHELFCEMARAGDNTWKNLFLAAYSDGNDGYLLRETIWDLNYTFGDAFCWDPENGNTVFLPDSTDNYELRYDRDYGYSTLASADPDLRKETAGRWRSWRESGISASYVNGMFEQQKQYLENSGALKRNTQRWRTGTDDSDYERIGKWLDARFAFMDRLYGLESDFSASE